MLHPSYLSACLSILTILLISVQQIWTERIGCQEDEFLCPVDNKCIPRSKLCNFVDDCLGGADEMQCGSCDFSLRKPEECGLILRADKAFAWFLREPLQEELSESVIFHENDPLYYIETNLNLTMKQYIHRHHDRLHAIHKPKILFPHLRPTNNDKCQAIVKMRITELNGVEAQLADIMEDTSWPQVKLLLIEPKEHLLDDQGEPMKGRENRKYTSVDFEVKKVSASKRGSWLSYAIPLGGHKTVWTLELVVEARIKSFLVQISSINYKDCEPIDAGLYDVEEASTEAPLETVCDSAQFRCELSGLCISRSLLCDYGHDCGEMDNSDEEYCDDYLGRCDFEDETLCDWMLPEDKSWLRVSAAEEDQPFYGPQLARPDTDHTYQSRTQGGNYLLLNATQLRMFTMYSLVGPHVSRRPEAAECSLRFWASTPSSLINSNSVRYPHLNVGRVHIPADLLFLDGTRTWHRHEVRLLSRSNIEESNIFSLLVGFGNFGSDLGKFLEAGGYLALDDFSFTPGCHLVFHGPALEDYTCSDDEFFCRIPTPVTGAHCIPLKYYCDFKSDCGLDDSLEFTAEDERDCSSECNLQSQAHCLSGIEIRDGVSKKLNNAYKVSDQVNEAFNWSMLLENTSGELRIQARSRDFLDHYKTEIAATKSGDGKQVRVVRNLRNLEIHLPSFSESHGNCLLELAYKWAQHTDNAIRAAIYLTNESRLTRHKLSKLIPDAGTRDKMQTIRIGLGQQRIPFRVMLDVYYADNLVNMTPYDGALSVYSYRFLDCAYPSGLLQVTREVEFERAEDDLDDDDMGAMEYLDYQYTSSVNTTCELGYFQCFEPVLCISEELVCDMQRDCQGGRDEHGCSKWLQYNFDGVKSNGSSHLAWSEGWRNEPSLGPQLLWSPTNGMTSARDSFNTGPPYDHTQSDYTGQYLATWGKPGQFNASQTASLVSPRFSTGPLCERIVFYLYFWGEHVNTLQVFRRSSAEEKLLYEVSGGDDDDKSRVDRWQRISLPLSDEAEDYEEMEIVFRAKSGSGPADLIALDDISLGPKCGLISSAQGDQRAPTSGPSTAGHHHHHHWTKVAVVLAIVTALLVIVSVRYQSRRMLDMVSSLGGLKEPNRDLATSGLMMELSLETLCSEQCPASNGSSGSSISRSYESQNHQL